MEKVLCIVQARMGSSRLPGKVMKPILGKPMIYYTLARLRDCKNIDEVVLATSDLEADTPLADYAEGAGFECFRGSEDDVLERYVQANRKYGGTTVIRVTGDCPLIAPELVDYTIKKYRESGKDYTVSNVLGGAPRGFDTEVFSAEALERAYETVSGLSDFKNYKEHVTIYMYNHPDEYSIEVLEAPEGYKRGYRLCVDEQADFDVVNSVFEHFKAEKFSGLDVIKFLDEHPEIAEINAHIEQKKS